MLDLTLQQTHFIFEPIDPLRLLSFLPHLFLILFRSIGQHRLFTLDLTLLDNAMGLGVNLLWSDVKGEVFGG